MNNLDLVISELSMIIFENDEISSYKLYELLENYIKNKWGKKIMPCNISYVISEAYKIYEKI